MAARDHSTSQSHTNPNSNKRGTTRTTGETSGTRNKNGTSPSRENTFLLASLEANHSGSLGSGGGEGLPVGTGTNPLPDQPGNIGRNPSTTGQKGSEKGSLTEQTIHQQALRDPKKGWIIAPSDQPQASQHLHGHQHFKMEGFRRRRSRYEKETGCVQWV